MNKLFLFTLGFFVLSSSHLFASTYKCFAKDFENQPRPYEIEVSLEPVSFKFTKFYQEESGDWKSKEEILSDSTGVKKPIPIRWSDCQINMNKTQKSHNIDWTYKNTGAGHISLNLESRTGEFYSSFQLGGNLYRLIRFFDCTEKN